MGMWGQWLFLSPTDNGTEPKKKNYTFLFRNTEINRDNPFFFCFFAKIKITVQDKPDKKEE